MPSNILRADYTGSEVCANCHSEIYARWAESPMRRMTRNAGTGAAAPPFDGRVFEFMGDSARLEHDLGHRYLTLDSKYEGHVRYRITRVIGGRHREDYVGVPLTGGKERVLPVSFMLGNGELRYKGYSVLSPERPGLKEGSVWSETCLFCHNTPHQLATLYDEISASKLGYQGSSNDRMLPPDRQWDVLVEDEEGLVSALGTEVELLTGRAAEAEDLADLLRVSASATRRYFQGDHLMEIGIACESCHGGSKAHAATPSLLPSYLPESDFLSTRPHDGTSITRAGAINRTCRRCHTVLFSEYSFTWEGGIRDRNPGGSSINSGEARDFQLGGCVDRLACTSCHDPHGKDDPDRLAFIESPAGNGVCQECHPAYQKPEALAAHTHHRADSVGSACVACHMPKKNMALDYDLTRYHRIASPTDTNKVERDRPMECALCHPASTNAEIASTMERWWGKRYDRSKLRELYPDLEQNAVVATLEHGKPHEQTVALTLLDAKLHPRAFELATAQLTNRYPLVRYYARGAIERLTGEKLPVDMSLPAERLEAEVVAWLAASRP